MSTNPAVVSPGNDALPSSYPDLDATSPTDSVIAGDFGQMSSADQVSIDVMGNVTHISLYSAKNAGTISKGFHITFD